MADQNIEPDNNHNHSNQPWNSLTPPLTAQNNNQQQQQIPTQANNNNEVVSSQSTSLASWGSSISMESTSPEVKEADELYDKIEDMLCDYMREPHRHYLHCRVLQWAREEDQSRIFTAVLIINPPTNQN